MQGASAVTAYRRVGALIDECDRAGVRCVVALNPDADLAHNGVVPAAEAEPRRQAYGEQYKAAVPPAGVEFCALQPRCATTARY